MPSSMRRRLRHCLTPLQRLCQLSLQLSLPLSALLRQPAYRLRQQLPARRAPTSTATATASPTNVPTATPTLEPTSTPEPPSSLDILTSAGNIMDFADSYHYVASGKMTIDDGDTRIDMPFNMTGDFEAPDRYQAHMTMSFLFFDFEFEMITIGDLKYTTNFDTGE